jgi:hypothetical protein
MHSVHLRCHQHALMIVLATGIGAALSETVMLMAAQDVSWWTQSRQ